MQRRNIMGMAGLCLALAGPVTAQDAPAACAEPAPLPVALAGWTSRGAMAAANDAKGLGAAMLAPGRAVDARLSRTGEVHYVMRPEKPGGSASHGGLFAFDVAEAGTYRVALGTGAWVDVLREGKAVASSAHGHGPECSGIRKMVDFPLKRGRHILHIAASGTPEISVMVSRIP